MQLSGDVEGLSSSSAPARNGTLLAVFVSWTAPSGQVSRLERVPAARWLQEPALRRRHGHGVGTLLGCLVGISSGPLLPSIWLSSRPSCGDSDHHRAGPTPVTLRHPET